MMFDQMLKKTSFSIAALFLSACGGGSGDVNESPVLSANVPQTVNELAMATLQVEATDPDGNIISYDWSQSAGVAVELRDSNRPQASFVAPEVDSNEQVSFVLTVTDNDGAVVSKNYQLEVVNVNKLPQLLVAAPTSVNEMSEVVFSIDASDEDGQISSIDWQQTAGPTVELTKDGSVLSFIAPSVDDKQQLSFTVVVIDSDGAQVTEHVDVMVNNVPLSIQHELINDAISEVDHHPSIFITSLQVNLASKYVKRVGFEILPLPNSKAQSIKASYSIDRLATTPSDITLPVYGLYRGNTNKIAIVVDYIDGSSSEVITEVATDSLIEPEESPFNSYTINHQMADMNKASFDYLVMRSGPYGPVIMDIDGNVRWQMALEPGMPFNGHSSLFDDGKFVMAIDDKLLHLGLDGQVTSHTIAINGLTNIVAHHELSKGKQGYLVELDAENQSTKTRILESILVEVDGKGQVMKYWDFAEIFVDYLLSQGENPLDFVRNGIDWFHMNSAIYDETDNSLLVSSRENFVVKIDYDTKEIKWILGDESKHWYVNYPSLRPLSLQSNDVKPIGQHALSIVDGELLLFNDGQLSFNQPEDAPLGKQLSSSPSAFYNIDESQMTASITWEYDPGIFSDVCSSVYQDSAVENGDLLVNYSAVNRLNEEPLSNIVQGINKNKELLFEFSFELKAPCAVSWNSSIIYGLNDLTFN